MNLYEYKGKTFCCFGLKEHVSMAKWFVGLAMQPDLSHSERRTLSLYQEYQVIKQLMLTKEVFDNMHSIATKRGLSVMEFRANGTSYLSAKKDRDAKRLVLRERINLAINDVLSSVGMCRTEFELRLDGSGELVDRIGRLEDGLVVVQKKLDELLNENKTRGNIIHLSDRKDK